MKEKPYTLIGVEGTQSQYDEGWVRRETAQLPVTIGNRKELIRFDIAELGRNDAILGYPWLWASNPRVNWRTGQLQWDEPEEDRGKQGRVYDIPLHGSYDAYTEAQQEINLTQICIMIKETKSQKAEEELVPKEY